MKEESPGRRKKTTKKEENFPEKGKSWSKEENNFEEQEESDIKKSAERVERLKQRKLKRGEEEGDLLSKSKSNAGRKYHFVIVSRAP